MQLSAALGEMLASLVVRMFGDGEAPVLASAGGHRVSVETACASTQWRFWSSVNTGMCVLTVAAHRVGEQRPVLCVGLLHRARRHGPVRVTALPIRGACSRA